MAAAKQPGLTRDHLRRIVEVAHAHHLGFVELVGLADLDPATAFRGATIRGTALRDQDLAGFDFTGAKLTGCDLTGADLSRAMGITEAMLAEARLDATTTLPPSSRAAFWATGHPPSWGKDWGHDAYGPWVTVRVPNTDVTQRMRWIPPGRFMMGSPETERGRDDDEGPRHKVTIAQGFWMFETACPEALWAAVMGEPPRRPRGPEFPVTDVSWDDAQDFARRLNAMLPGLAIGLPSEAEWEFACRAGTIEATYAGPAVVDDKDNAAVLNEIAWWRGNSDREIHPVGLKKPNAWGLHDMLGNVWEWCEDNWHGNYIGAPDDGAVWLGGGAAKGVIRGGARSLAARDVRAACRFGGDPEVRDDGLGFRCARGHSVSEATCEPREARRGKRWERSDHAAAARLTRLTGPPRSGGRKISVPHTPGRAPAAPEKPAWAAAAGTDTFGSWADIEVPADRGAVVTQRLRLIPPGRFMMGSLPGEPGRSVLERPRHAVTIGEGFWLFDTPCTQAFWQTIMGSNPSRFQSFDRPVESVSFLDVQQFLARVNDRVSGLNLTLPSEARWEYACRADSETATYAGPIEVLGTNNVPVLDRIAWYSGNSGVAFDLDNGAYSGGWPEKQYQHRSAGTHPVKGKEPNLWGLYDMLGNVWEWCEDRWHSSYAGAPSDGSAWLGDIAGNSAGSRIVRGGSWNSPAHDVRAACRAGIDLQDGVGSFGFRCARIQDKGERRDIAAGPASGQ